MFHLGKTRAALEDDPLEQSLIDEQIFSRRTPFTRCEDGRGALISALEQRPHQASIAQALLTIR